ncbi:hypothetical protein ACFYYI_08515 [Streptomyces sp. NPDC002387]|uniref:hypothetical protein n=1 Tax=Streptomyces sp. NPDC002387 TaxID=3364643 RepID=UPI003690170D
MWGYADFTAKAKLYFRRASEHDRVDEEFSIWLLLGLEFLLRAPLAKASPILLAVPEGPSILHAAGFASASQAPRSIPYKTVCDRLKVVVPEFGKVHDDAMYLANVRNEELHTSTATLANLENGAWMPKFIRVVDVLIAHLELELTDFLDSSVIEHARALAYEEDAKVKRAIELKLKAAKEFYGKLLPAEIEQRRATPAPQGRIYDEVACPACGEIGRVFMKGVRSTRERIEEDEILTEEVAVGVAFECPVCGLTLTGVPELKAASLPTEKVWTWAADASERFEIENYAGEWEDYGND